MMCSGSCQRKPGRVQRHRGEIGVPGKAVGLSGDRAWDMWPGAGGHVLRL